MAVSILYGNGLNRTSGAPSWDNIMSQLYPLWPIKGISSNHVPNTIQYDQLALQYIPQNSTLLQNLCNIIVNGQWQNAIYQALAQRTNTNFITINYDFTLEHSYQHLLYTHSHQFKPSIWEKLYNVYTYYEPIQNIRIWHIHGDINRPQSIILGYDHYCKQIAKINQSLPPQYTGKNIITAKQQYNESTRDSWATHMFTDDVYIVGCGLGFTELDLWWLIDKWANFQKTRQLQGLPPTNKIVYLEADIPNRKIDRYEKIYRLNFQTVLHDFGIEYQYHMAQTWVDAYLLCVAAVP